MNSTKDDTAPVDRVDYLTLMEQCGIPTHLRDGLQLYLAHHIPTGSFLRCVLSNDLRGAINRADSDSRDGLLSLMTFLSWHAPAGSWGSPAAVDLWLAARAS